MTKFNRKDAKNKVCIYCFKELSLNEKNFELRTDTGNYRGGCKNCMAVRSAQRYQENKEDRRRQARKRSAELRAKRERKRTEKENRMKETGLWKDIEGFESSYMISNCGEVYSKLTGKMRKITVRDDGYNVVPLWKDNKGSNRYVHRLVLQHFSDEPENETVNHKDGNKNNNHISNLEWMSYAGNNEHAIKTGLTNHEHFLPENNVRSMKVLKKKDGEVLAGYPSMRSAERENNLANGSVSQAIKTGWNYGGYEWELNE